MVVPPAVSSAARQASAQAASATAAPRKLRLLALCGYLQSAAVFRQRTGSLRKAVKAKAELVFAEPPHLAPAAKAPTPAMAAQPGSDGSPSDGSAASEAAGDAGACGAAGEASERRAWWVAREQLEDPATPTRPSLSKSYAGVEQSVEMLEAQLASERYDGVIGFSQGAAMAALLLARAAARRQQQPEADAAFGGPHFGVLVSGFVPRDARWAAELSAGGAVALPSMHIYGEGDTLVPTERARAFVEAFDGSMRAEHPHAGGHGIPTGAEFRQDLRAFLDERLKEAHARDEASRVAEAAAAMGEVSM